MIDADELATLAAERETVAATQAKKLSRGDSDQERAWNFYLLYNEKHGAYGWRRFDKTRPGNPLRLSRRQFIERLIRIEDKSFNVVPLAYNQSQRNLEALVLRSERRGEPVRIVIVKVRQNGTSTYTLALCVWLLLTRTNKKLRIVTDREDLCKLLLNRLRLMLRNLRKPDGTPWNLPLVNSNRDEVVFGEPFNSSVHVVSANTPSAGFGETMSLVDMEETSKWNDAKETAKGVLMTLPALPQTYAFDVSQPKGNSGYFADKWAFAWRRKMGLAQSAQGLDPILNMGAWQPLFIPWFLHEEYQWSRVGSNDKATQAQLQSAYDAVGNSLDEDEKVLLKQRFFRRGKGWLTVGLDQLAWRRFWIDSQCNGSLDTFHEQCPAFPEEAFLASGRSAFNARHVQRAMANHKRPPQFVGDIIEAA